MEHTAARHVVHVATEHRLVGKLPRLDDVVGINVGMGPVFGHDLHGQLAYGVVADGQCLSGERVGVVGQMIVVVCVVRVLHGALRAESAKEIIGSIDRTSPVYGTLATESAEDGHALGYEEGVVQ